MGLEVKRALSKWAQGAFIEETELLKIAQQETERGNILGAPFDTGGAAVAAARSSALMAAVCLADHDLYGAVSETLNVGGCVLAMFFVPPVKMLSAASYAVEHRLNR
jgi:hypothetical protein